METPEDEHSHERNRSHEHVIGQRCVKIQPADDRTPDSAKAIFAARYRRPPECDGIKHGGEREREQREINAAPAQDERAEGRRDQRHEANAHQNRNKEAAGKKFTLRDAGGVGGEPEPGAVAERDKAGISDEYIERHTGHGIDDDFRRRSDAEPHHRHEEWQRDQAGGGDEERCERADHHGITRTAGYVRRTIRAGGKGARAASSDRSRRWRIAGSRRRRRGL